MENNIWLKHLKELPQTKAGMVQYLASDLFKGIGKRTAEKLWTISENMLFLKLWMTLRR